jgi:adenylate cyclase
VTGVPTRALRRTLNAPMVAAAIGAAAAMIVLAIHVEVVAVPALAKLEGITVDARFRWRGPRAPATDRVVIVGIDDRTRAEAPEVSQTRHGWATFLRALAGYDPKAIALDAYFAYPEVILPDALAVRVRAAAQALDADRRPSPPPDWDRPAIEEARRVLHDVVHELEGDADVADAVAEAGRVILGANFWLVRGGEQRTTAREPVGLARGRHGEVVSGGGGDRAPATAYDVEFTMARIAERAAGAGAINTFRDDDGVVRRLPLVIAFGPHHYMSLGLAAALVELGAPGETQYVAGADHIVAGGRTIPLGKSATLSLDFLGRDRIPRISAADVIAGRAPREALAGKLVFVGLTYASYDKVATPLDLTADGVELHATLAENILSGHYLRTAGDLTTYLVTALLLGLVVISQHRRIRRRAYLPAAIAAAAITIWVVIAIVAFGAQSLVLPIAAPAVLALIVAAVALIAGVATEGREKRQLRAAFSQYVASSVVERIIADPRLARLGGERRELTVLFSDIRGFSRLAESLAPEALAGFLSEYLTPMTELVLASEGTLDKYIGDAVMALWGAPVELLDHADRACACALAMQARLVELNASWQKLGLPEVAIGIGINTGPMSVGNMGSKDRFDYTAIGDAVNLGSRLEALTKEYGIGILVGAETARAVGDRFVLRELDLVRVKGRDQAAPVFELLGHADDRAARARELATWNAALAKYRARDFAAAADAFAAITGDPAAATLAARARALAIAPPGDDWDGVYDQRSK